MSVPDAALPTCVNHPSRETALRCGKCGDPICTKCVIQTPVGGRCRACANLRRLPQYQVDPLLLVRSTAGALAASVVAWWLLAYVPSLRFFLSIFAGLAIGEVMSRLAQRRAGLLMEVAAVSAVIGGFVIAAAIHPDAGGTLSRFGQGNQLVYDIVPVVIASITAVIKLR